MAFHFVVVVVVVVLFWLKKLSLPVTILSIPGNHFVPLTSIAYIYNFFVIHSKKNSPIPSPSPLDFLPLIFRHPQVFTIEKRKRGEEAGK